MSQHDFDIANASGAAVRADINNALVALAGTSIGASAPSTTYAGQRWFDTTANILKIRNAANTNWVNEAQLVGTTWIPYRSGSLLGTAAVATTGVSGNVLGFLDGANAWSALQKWAKGADVASSATLTLGNDGNVFDITGTTSITAIGAKGIGTTVKLQFDAALILTHNATDLILPGGADIITAAGDVAEFFEYAAGDWLCTNFQRAASPLGSVGDLTNGGADDLTEFDITGIRADATRITIPFNEASLSGTDSMLVQLGDSGGFETTGYVSTSLRSISSGEDSSTVGFIINTAAATDVFSGLMTLVLSDRANNTWISSHAGKLATIAIATGGGHKSLSAALDRIRITRDGTDTFDGGEVNILVE